MYRKYYSYSDMPQLIKHEDEKPEVHNTKNEEKKLLTEQNQPGKFLGRFETDDIILAVIILALLLDDGDDSVLLLALAFIFLTGIV